MSIPNNLWKFAISIASFILVFLHLFVPSINIDTITLILFAIAGLPWVIPYLRGVEIPGVMKITLPDMKAATDKVKSSGDKIINAKTAHVAFETFPATIELSKPFETLREVYDKDPNLALVGFRIEIEERLIHLAKVFGISTETKGLTSILSELVKKEIVSSTVSSGLSDIIALGNQAAHGVKVSSQAGKWVLDNGPSILLELESVNSSKK